MKYARWCWQQYELASKDMRFLRLHRAGDGMIIKINTKYQNMCLDRWHDACEAMLSEPAK